MAVDTNALSTGQLNRITDQERPLKLTTTELLNYQLTVNYKMQTNLKFRKNLVYLDKRTNGKTQRKEYDTYDIDRHVESFRLTTQIEDYDNVDLSLMSITFRPGDQEKIHVSTQEVMNVIEQIQVQDEFSYVSIVSELGGILYLIYIIGTVLSAPMAEFNFKIDAIRQIMKQQKEEKDKEDSKAYLT